MSSNKRVFSIASNVLLSFYLNSLGSNYYFYFIDTIPKVQRWSSCLKPQIFSGIAEVCTQFSWFPTQSFVVSFIFVCLVHTFSVFEIELHSEIYKSQICSLINFYKVSIPRSSQSTACNIGASFKHTLPNHDYPPWKSKF